MPSECGVGGRGSGGLGWEGQWAQAGRQAGRLRTAAAEGPCSTWAVPLRARRCTNKQGCGGSAAPERPGARDLKREAGGLRLCHAHNTRRKDGARHVHPGYQGTNRAQSCWPRGGRVLSRTTSSGPLWQLRAVVTPHSAHSAPTLWSLMQFRRGLLPSNSLLPLADAASRDARTFHKALAAATARHAAHHRVPCPAGPLQLCSGR